MGEGRGGGASEPCWISRKVWRHDPSEKCNQTFTVMLQHEINKIFPFLSVKGRAAIPLPLRLTTEYD